MHIPTSIHPFYMDRKLIDVKQWPDTVKVRHILIATQEQGQFVREDSTE